ncbi:MAG TPA: class I SAM-dependent methyltransferase [Allosphingosinicella sp.]|jgi:SAM-dependent methyltransferase|nr:class I SAM-dependent methyltransferase [Allosphingosinicella sp.]
MSSDQAPAARRRAKRALERQLDYIRAKTERLNAKADTLIPELTERSLALRKRLEAIRPFGPDVKLLEVGSGVTGHVFFFGAENGVGVDPLADAFRPHFPWHRGVRTVAAGGENLPFADGAFDIVMSDNVVDHAEDPARIAAEMVRVLAPGGLLYFTVNVHHPFYAAAAGAHAVWQSLGLPGEIGPFADHTVHLTPSAAGRLFAGQPLRTVSEGADIDAAKREGRTLKPRHAGDLFKRIFYKNAVYELVAVKEG